MHFAHAIKLILHSPVAAWRRPLEFPTAPVERTTSHCSLAAQLSGTPFPSSLHQLVSSLLNPDKTCENFFLFDEDLKIYLNESLSPMRVGAAPTLPSYHF